MLADLAGLMEQAAEEWDAGDAVTPDELRGIARDVRAIENRLAVLEAREQARLSTRAYSTSPSGYGGLKAQGRWIRPDEEVDHQSLRDGDPP